jgi:hypothetical protein
MNQALSFGLLATGGILLTKALTGSSFADVVKGHPGTVSTVGAQLTVAGVGAAAANIATGAAGGTGKAIGTTGKAGLTSGQATFADELSAKTGLSAAVIAAWLLAEESGSAAAFRQSAGNNDWLNIGYTDTATLGAANSVWNDPTSAADATAQWLAGTWSDPGFGSASSGIRSILATAGQSAAAQIAAIQHSGWASSGYPDLPSIYSEVAA